MKTKTKTSTCRLRSLLARVIVGVLLSTTAAEVVEASTFDTALIVNTESFQTIDDGSGTSNIELRFGDSANEILRWDVSNTRFQFTDDLHVEGNITSSGSLKADGAIATESNITLNQDADSNNAVVTFGSDTTNETITWANTPDQFEVSDDVEIIGTASGTQIHAQVGLSSSGGLTWEGSASGAALWTSTFEGAGLTDCDADNQALSWDATLKKFICGDDDTAASGMSFTEASSYYVNDSGDSMTGGLLIQTLSNGAAATIDAGLQLEVVGTASGKVIHGQDQVTTSGAIRADGNITLNDDLSAADTILTFGSDTTSETLKFLNAEDRFEFSDDLAATGNITASGTLTVEGAAATKSNFTLNSDSGGVDAVVTFGSDNTNETLTFDNTQDRFEFSNDSQTQGNLSVTGQLSGATLQTAGNANVFGTLSASGTLKSDGDFIINDDATAADTVLTFGSDNVNESLKFLNSEDRFEFSDDLHATGKLSTSGTLVVESNAKFKSTVTLNGVTYTFPAADGSSGSILKTNGAGSLYWAKDAGPGSGDILYLQPEYHDAIYFASGTTMVGQLAMSGSTSDNENYYLWKSTSATQQDYWVSIRARVPDNFVKWDPVKPIQFRYQTKDGNTAVSHLTVRLKDTGGTAVALGTGALSNAAWRTLAITGPESAGTWTPGSYFTAYVKLATTTAGWAKAGFIQFNWETKAP